MAHLGIWIQKNGIWKLKNKFEIPNIWLQKITNYLLTHGIIFMAKFVV